MRHEIHLSDDEVVGLLPSYDRGRQLIGKERLRPDSVRALTPAVLARAEAAFTSCRLELHVEFNGAFPVFVIEDGLPNIVQEESYFVLAGSSGLAREALSNRADAQEMLRTDLGVRVVLSQPVAQATAARMDDNDRADVRRVAVRDRLHAALAGLPLPSLPACPPAGRVRRWLAEADLPVPPIQDGQPERGDGVPA